MKIFIDAGHGGDDPGASGSISKYGGPKEDIKEKDITLAFARELKSQITAQLGATVVMSRDSDTNPSINTRADNAYNNSVDAIISIHFNAFNGTVSGTETFYAQTRPNDKAFADALHNNIMTYFGYTDRGVKDDTKSARGELGILRRNNGSYPRALIEVEFIDNYQAMTDVIGYDYYERMLDFCNGVVRGLMVYFGL